MRHVLAKAPPEKEAKAKLRSPENHSVRKKVAQQPKRSRKLMQDQ